MIKNGTLFTESKEVLKTSEGMSKNYWIRKKTARCSCQVRCRKITVMVEITEDEAKTTLRNMQRGSQTPTPRRQSPLPTLSMLYYHTWRAWPSVLQWHEQARNLNVSNIKTNAFLSIVSSLTIFACQCLVSGSRRQSTISPNSSSRVLPLNL